MTVHKNTAADAAASDDGRPPDAGPQAISARPLITLPVAVQMRLARKADLPRLEWYGQYAHFRNLFRRAYVDQMQGKRLMLLADFNGFPIGHVFVQLASSNARIADGKHRAYLYSFRVMEMFRGMGIGTRLMQAAEELLAERGYTTATIAVAKDNHGALRLYERLGYFKFASDPGQWSYVDHRGSTHQVSEPCWLLRHDFGS